MLLTHYHTDHTDPETLIPLSGASPNARFLCPFTSRDLLAGTGFPANRAMVPEVGVPGQVDGATVTAIPSAHTALDHDPQRGYPYLGYVIECNGVTVYHAGDTIVYDKLMGTLRVCEVDVAFVPINGRDDFRTRDDIVGNTDFREAAHLAEELDFGLIVLTHYDMFEDNAADPGHFVSYL